MSAEENRDGVKVLMAARQISVLNGWIDATADFDRFYIGGTLLTCRSESAHERQNGHRDSGYDWNPTLICGTLIVISGQETPNNACGGAANTQWPMLTYQVRGGVRPIDKIDIMASVTYANAVVKPTANWANNSYGWEVDLTGTYKITNNLSYMLGLGYLFTGDYFKGEADDLGFTGDVQNNFLVINKLTLTF